MSQKLNIDHELYEAAAKGNSERVTELLSQDYDFDFSYKHHRVYYIPYLLSLYVIILRLMMFLYMIV